MAEKMIRANGIDICTEAFGNPSAAPLLLVMGAGCSMLLWEEAFCRKLAAGGRFVIRFDNRDTGRTPCFDFATAPYTLADMAADAVGILDAYRIDSAHVVGASMGGMIAQHLALDHRHRVRTITAIMSTADPSPLLSAAYGRTAPANALPPPTEAVLRLVIASTVLDPADVRGMIEQRVELFRVLWGSAHPYDEARMRAIFVREAERAIDYVKAANHGLAMARTPRWLERLRTLDIPTLVIHGTEDGSLPFVHGQALANAIPGAKLLPLEGVGHALPEQEWDRIASAIVEHTEERS